MRAVAVLLVALNHAGVGFLKGGYVGVDVFFVLSGYLITGLLVSAADRVRGRRYFAEFYARRARRILPAATLTLVVTSIASVSLLNLERAHQVLVDSVYAALFAANFHFASIGTNYFAQGQPPSPLQHYWSLSVEEQFYLLWPLLVAIALLGMTFRGRRRHHANPTSSRGALRGLGVVAAIVTVVSFAYAVYDTHHNATAAYFSSPARAWELGLGAILSLNARRIARLPPALLLLAGWLGILAILGASTAYSASTLFPGLAALLPTAGAAAVIAAGLRVDQSRVALSRILSLRPFGYVGDRSYTFYLWHWPVLILVAEHAGHSLSLATNLLLLVGAFALSIVTYRLFENPLRQTPRLRGAVALALWPAAIAAVLFTVSLHWADYQNAVNLARVYAPPEILKSESVDVSATSPSATPSGWRPSSQPVVMEAVAAAHASRRLPSPMIPSALELSAQSSRYSDPAGCYTNVTGTRSTICSLGDTTGKKTLVVFGDSHADMWMPAILYFAQHNGYVVRPVIKLGCTARAWAGSEIAQAHECETWYRWAVSQVRRLHPSLLIIGTHYNTVPYESNVEEEAPSIIKNISALAAAVRSSVHRIVVIGDPPGQEQEPTDCLLSSRATMKRCSWNELPAQATATTEVESATKAFGLFLDTTPWFCYESVCPMVIGHTVVNYDRSHTTLRYTEELAPLFSSGLARLLVPHGTTSSHRIVPALRRTETLHHTAAPHRTAVPHSFATPHGTVTLHHAAQRS